MGEMDGSASRVLTPRRMDDWNLLRRHRPARWWCLVLSAFVFALAACDCVGPGLNNTPPPELAINPARLVLPDTYVGHPASATIRVANVGGQDASAEVRADAPFVSSVSSVQIVRGGFHEFTVEIPATDPGYFERVLRIGSVEVPVEARVNKVPACLTPSVCSNASFDPVVHACVVTPHPEGKSCSTRCVLDGACIEGTCRGQFQPCDDGDACTLDACNEESGCIYLYRECVAPGDPCKVARCDSVLGCVAEVAPDGTLCGADDCRAAQVDVCIAGQCTSRPRPDTGRCVNTWLPTAIPPRMTHAFVFDAARGRAVVFGGHSHDGPVNDTWEWDGAHWTQRLSASAPSPRYHVAAVYDSFRQRIVLFGGANASTLGLPFADTWEWDGTNWVERMPVNSPPGREGAALAYDGARRVVILFGGRSSSGQELSDTWEWDGTNWRQLFPSASPSGRFTHSMTYDSVRHRVVLFGGVSGAISRSDTWEWNGTTWLEQAPAHVPPGGAGSALTFDPVRKRVVRVGGLPLGASGGQAAATWEWDGVDWQVRSTASGPPDRLGAGLVFDPKRNRSLLFGGWGQTPLGDLWEWDGVAWVEAAGDERPYARGYEGVVDDTAHGQVVLFGGDTVGYQVLGDTWAWDENGWSRFAPAHSPSPRQGHAMAYDSVRGRVVLFGGANQSLLSDTWEWDGKTWTLRTPNLSPPARRSHSLAFDADRGRVLLFGGSQTMPLSGTGKLLNDTWEWDGANWVEVNLHSTSLAPPPRASAALVHDVARKRTILFGGQTQPGFYDSDTWEWDGTNWSPGPQVTGSQPSAPASMAYDDVRQTTVLFDGLRRTWEWSGGTWSLRTPTQSPRASGGSGMAFHRSSGRTVLVGGDGVVWVFLP